MRRMRDLPWKYLVLAVPAVAAAFGIQYTIRKWYPEAKRMGSQQALKPSYFRADSAGGSEAEKMREVASTESKPVKDGKSASAAATEKNKEKRTAATTPSEEDIETYGAMDDAGSEPGAKPGAKDDENDGLARYSPSMVKLNEQKSEEARAHSDAPKAVSEQTEVAAAVTDPVDTSNRCMAVEYRGDGPEHTKITKDEWSKFMKTFHGAKGALLAWLKKHRRQFPDKTADIMDAQVRNLRIQRPPSHEEPDLAWRGIGVWSQDTAGKPVLRIGNGFVKLILKQPARGKFEMTRLVAQAWAPCELLRVDAGLAWNPLLKCMQVQEERACAAGTYSEAGWAVSTALANIVSPPGCNVPALADQQVAKCLKKLPLPLSVADSGIPRTAWKEARR